jgi:hypothetical protein
MHLTRGAALASVLLVLAGGVGAQGDPDRVVPNGGIFAPGWKGRIDASSIKQGRTINDSRFELKDGVFVIAAGPAAIYWNPANTASGDYTVSATFREPKYMSANSHPHPYGVFIAGHKLDTEEPSLLYCSAYGNGTFIVRGFGPAPFQMGGRRPTPHDAVNRAGEDGSVTQQIAWRVKGGRAECVINGAVVASYDRSELVGPGKLESLDGVYGLRVSHNLDVIVSGFTLTKQ